MNFEWTLTSNISGGEFRDHELDTKLFGFSHLLFDTGNPVSKFYEFLFAITIFLENIGGLNISLYLLGIRKAAGYYEFLLTGVAYSLTNKLKMLEISGVNLPTHKIFNHTLYSAFNLTHNK